MPKLMLNSYIYPLDKILIRRCIADAQHLFIKIIVCFLSSPHHVAHFYFLIYIYDHRKDPPDISDSWMK
jgi:hypothetical protein